MMPWPRGTLGFMDRIDATYLAAVTLAAAVARALKRGLPEGWRLRLEAGLPELQPGWIWLHAVSVGELLLADGILGRLREAGYRVHVTTGTPAGLELLGRRLEGWNQGSGRITGGAFPVDDAEGLRPFLAAKPGAFIALETELWPNLLRCLEAAGVSRVVVNGRLTEKSLKRGGPWLRRAASRLSLVAARDSESAKAFIALGAPRVVLGGNLKADLPEPKPLHSGWDALRSGWASDPVLVVGNTLEGEEDLVLEAWAQARKAHPGLRWILAPRQPRRFEGVAEALLRKGLRFRRASQGWPSEAKAWADHEGLLLDTLGELAGAYREGTVALVGGGWTWHGGHNPLESVRYGLPTLMGPGYGNFEDLVEPLKEAGRVEIVGIDELSARLSRVFDGCLLRPGAGAEQPLPESLRGTLGKTWDFLKESLPSVR